MGAWWEPGFQWLDGLPSPHNGDDLHSYLALFERWGFEFCDTPNLEPGCLKIAVYAKENESHHVAKQLRSGE